jgi:hypothetical protein
MLTRLNIAAVFLSQHHLLTIRALQLLHFSLGLSDGNDLHYLAAFPALEHLSIRVVEQSSASSSSSNATFDLPSLPHLQSLRYETQHARHGEVWCSELASTLAKRCPRLPLSRLTLQKGPAVLTQVSDSTSQCPRHLLGWTIYVECN